MTINSAQPRTALIVDDESALLGLLDEILTDAGFVTTGFERGQPALEMIAQRPFNLLVIDVNLPDTSGLAVCQFARERYGEDVAILIITADSRMDRLVTAFDLGADDFVPKPFDVEELLTRIETKLRRTAEG